MFNGNQMEGGIGPGDLKACLLKSSLLWMGVGEGGVSTLMHLKDFHCFLAAVVCSDSDFSNIYFPIGSVLFFSGHFEDFFYTCGFQQFDCDMRLRGFR